MVCDVPKLVALKWGRGRVSGGRNRVRHKMTPRSNTVARVKIGRCPVS